MKTREEALAYGLSFPYTYKEAPFHDQNWELVRVHGSKKAFLWVYERNGYINMNVKVNPERRTSGERHTRRYSRDIIRIRSIGIRLFWTEPFRMTR